jgi:aminoglycoside phosphotransferase (APT) family kinase protein
VTPRTRLAALVDPVVDWLIHLARHTRLVGPPGRRVEDLSTLIDRARRHATTGDEREALDRVSGHLRRAGPRCPLRVFEHGDLATWNLMMSPSGAIVVLDWERSTPDGVPTWDLFYFLAHYGFLMHETSDPGPDLAAFRETYFSLGPFGRTVARAVRRYTGALDVSEDWLVTLFLSCWVHHTLSDLARGVRRLSDSPFWHMAALTLDRDCRLNFLASDPAGR